MSENPFTTQRELLSETGLTVGELKQIEEVVRSSGAMQDLMLKQGLGRGYWGSTVPLVQQLAIRP